MNTAFTRWPDEYVNQAAAVSRLLAEAATTDIDDWKDLIDGLLVPQNVDGDIPLFYAQFAGTYQTLAAFCRNTNSSMPPLDTPALQYAWVAVSELVSRIAHDAQWVTPDVAAELFAGAVNQAEYGDAIVDWMIASELTPGVAFPGITDAGGWFEPIPASII